jgi:hypothetical protein
MSSSIDAAYAAVVTLCIRAHDLRFALALGLALLRTAYAMLLCAAILPRLVLLGVAWW